LILFCVATLRSVLEAANVEPNQPRFWDQIESKQTELSAKVTALGGESACMKSDPALLRELANAYWLNGKTYEAGLIYSQFWAEGSKDNSKYNPQFVEDALSLANVYQAQGAFKHAANCYESIFGYDINRLPKEDPAIARDANNLAVAYYLNANTKTTKKDQYENFIKSKVLYAMAETTATATDKAPYLVPTIKTNWSFLTRDYQRGK